MKLFLTSMLAVTAPISEAKRPTRLETLRMWRDGKLPVSNARELKCPQNLNMPANALEVIYNDQTGRAEAICKAGYFVDRTGGPIKSKCKKIKQPDGTRVYGWNQQLPDCVTCKIEDPEEKIISGDDGLSVYCSYRANNEKRCFMTCIDDRQKVIHNMFNGRSQKKANIDCRCKKDGCKWTSHGKKAMWLNRFSCDGNGKLEPWVPPVGCKNKPAKCTEVTPRVQVLNSWTCRNCFRVRAFYKFKHFDITNFDNQDYIELEFNEPVGWIKHSHPADGIEQKNEKTFRISFHKMATFVNKEMDFTAEIRSAGAEPPRLLEARSCPCSKQ